MELQFALAQPCDLEDMVRIHCEAWKSAYRGIISDDFIQRKNRSRYEKWRGILSVENRKHYIIRRNGIAVGMISMDLPREVAEPETYEIFGLYILPEYERMGYGTAAFRFAENRIRETGYRKISLWVLEPNLPARKFYEKLGFTADGAERTSYYDKPIRLLRYTRSCV